ncbi:hypothetical protein QZH41_003735 [Actinostola sp. cb2023]|nr:hypothetical protein QZH41_003735 [Actinostola sp. cb2023]
MQPQVVPNDENRVRLAAGTEDSLIGKLRMIFSNQGNWDERFRLGNPAAHPSIKNYLRSIQLEQAQSRASPFDKFRKIVSHLYTCLLDLKIVPIQRYILAHDLAFFIVEFFSGDRSSDLGRE